MSAAANSATFVHIFDRAGGGLAAARASGDEACLIDGFVEQLQDERAASYDADASREEVVANEALEDAALSR